MKSLMESRHERIWPSLMNLARRADRGWISGGEWNLLGSERRRERRETVERGSRDAREMPERGSREAREKVEKTSREGLRLGRTRGGSHELGDSSWPELGRPAGPAAEEDGQ